jgi:hypothetical protein
MSLLNDEVMPEKSDPVFHALSTASTFLLSLLNMKQASYYWDCSSVHDTRFEPGLGDRAAIG